MMSIGDMSDWIIHHGNGRPVARDVYVEVELRSSYIHDPKPAGFWGDGKQDQSNWWHETENPHPSDIMQYRVVSK